MIDPASVPVHYYNVIEDLLLAILNKLPAPNGNPLAFLDGTFNWSIPAGGVGTTLPIGSRQGDTLIWDTLTGSWAIWGTKGVFQYDQGTGNGTIQLSQTDSIKFGDAIITGDGNDSFCFNCNALLTGVLGWEEYNKTIGPSGDNLAINCPIQATDVLMSGDISMRNKAGDAYQGFARRDDTGAYSLMNLLNIKSINDQATDSAGIYAPSRELFFRNGAGRAGTKDQNDFYLMSNDSARFVVGALGHFYPFQTGAHSLGSVTNKFYRGYFSDLLICDTVSHDNGTTKYKIAAQTAGAVTLNAGAYIPITINGTTYKLLISN